jgi:hypothetical protein
MSILDSLGAPIPTTGFNNLPTVMYGASESVMASPSDSRQASPCQHQILDDLAPGEREFILRSRRGSRAVGHHDCWSL